MHRPSKPRLLLPLVALIGALALEGCGDDGPVGPDTSLLELVLVQGDGQMAEPASPLPDPLKVRVQSISSGRGEEGIQVMWQVVTGSGALLEPGTSLSDADGVASTTLTLGEAVGSYRVRASVSGMESPPVEFSAQAILVPELSLVPSGPVEPGDTVLLSGRNFSPQAELNVVTFSGLRGEVVSATDEELRAVVPLCLPDRWVQVRVRIGSLVTSSFPLQVMGSPRILELEPGEDRVLDAGQGLCNLHLPSIPQSQYLVVPHSTGTVGGAEYGIRVVGLTEDGVEPLAEASGGTIPSLLGGTPRRGDHPTTQERFKRKLRQLEGEALAAARARGEAYTSPGPVGAEEGPARTPQVGDRREFRVLNPDHGFDRITAVVRRVSEHGIIYLDEDVPGGGYAEIDLAEMETHFEAFIHPTVTGAFGSESDLDGNGRVIILLTPAVNRLTEDATQGIIAGFFFGIDLLQGATGSNEGEVFYAVVPDPTGTHGPILPRSRVMEVVPAILAHEFEHMIHFNQRMLLGGAKSQEALWLSEALAQMAEDLVGWEFFRFNYLQEAEVYRGGNYDRARLYLLEPSQVSLLASLPPGTLAERGAGWLFLKCLSEQEGRDDLLGNLVRSTLVGVANVTAAAGKGWASLLADHFGVLMTDNRGLEVRPELECGGIVLWSALRRGDTDYPLQPPHLGWNSFSRITTLASSAPDYLLISPPASGGVALGVSGSDGRPPESGSGLRVLVVRIR